MPRPPNQRDMASYLVDIIVELRRLAERAGLVQLTRVLDMALREARRQRDDS